MNKLKFKPRYYALVAIDNRCWQRLVGAFGGQYWPTLKAMRCAIKSHMRCMDAVRKHYPSTKAKYLIFKEVKDKLVEKIDEYKQRRRRCLNCLGTGEVTDGDGKAYNIITCPRCRGSKYE